MRYFLISSFLLGSLLAAEPANMPPQSAQQPSAAITRSPSDQVTYATVKIECTLPSGRTSSGTGFFYSAAKNKETQREVPLLITNKHVIKDALTGTFNLHLADDKNEPIPGKSIPISIDKFEEKWTAHPDGITDLCALPIAPILNDLLQKNIKVYRISLDASLVPSDVDLQDIDVYEHVLMVGYPIGLWDSVNNMPILRTGATATSPSLDYEGRPEFMIDAACFPGSSGSPVLLWDSGAHTNRKGETSFGTRIKLLGVLYAGPQETIDGEIKVVTIPTSRQAPIALSRIPVNLGYVIKAKKLLDFDALAAKAIAEQK
ncbi:MAG TPA: serine protease [Candidatus Didemnitutus sp.]|nr:serine protease [Candidatus Didemnitutus sp.]